MTSTSTEPQSDYPQFMAIKRILKLPVVSSGVNKVTYIYVKVKVRGHKIITERKKRQFLSNITYLTIYYYIVFFLLCFQSSNRFIGYSLNNAEKTVLSVVDISTPIVVKFEDPINKIDSLMCKSLDLVEYNVPMVTYTPEEVSNNFILFVFIIIYLVFFFFIQIYLR